MAFRPVPPQAPPPAADDAPIGPAQAKAEPVGASSRLTDRPVARWIVLGTGASVLAAFSGARIGSIPDTEHYRWWFSLPSLSSPLMSVLFYAATALLVIAWLGLRRPASRGWLTARRTVLVLVCWGVPMLLGPPLFSRDLYSYIGQGLVASHGSSPYSVAPSAIANPTLLGSIAGVWRDTTSPYGPLFVVATKALAAVAPRSLIVEVIVFRALELVGVVLLIVFLPRIARRFAANEGLALWLGVLSPLALFSFVASGHNDALMVGLLVAGVSCCLERRTAIGLGLCALASTIKLPAAAAVVFLVADEASVVHGARRVLLIARRLVVPIGVFVGVTLACGLGWAFLGPNALHIPTELRIDQTPAVSLGILVFHVLHGCGLPVAQSVVVTVTETTCAVLAGVAVLWLLSRPRRHEVVRSLAIALEIVVLAGPTVWPWYLVWGLVLLAATRAQYSRVLAVVASLAMFAVGPEGRPLLQGGAYLVVALAVLAAGAWLVRARRWETVVSGYGI